jgi:hypothetical protein
MDPKTMFTVKKNILASAILASLLPCSAAETTPAYSMVLVGGGLNTCSSQSSAACRERSQFPSNAKTSEQYAISLAMVRQIGQSAVWPSSRSTERQQTQAILTQLLADFGSAPMPETEFLQRWRLVKVAQPSGEISGETLYQQLSELELNLILDHLQQPVLDANQQRQPELASLAQTTDPFSVEIYQKISELAGKVRQKPGKPKILVVTASGRDPLVAVDFYLSAFLQTGADVEWLPLNAAYQAAQQEKIAGKASCAKLPQHLAQIHGSYQRGVVFPDLMQQLQQFCQHGPAGAVAKINAADAIFFNGGDCKPSANACTPVDWWWPAPVQEQPSKPVAFLPGGQFR